LLFFNADIFSKLGFFFEIGSASSAVFHRSFQSN